MLLLLIVFSAGLFSAMEALRYTRTELAMGTNPLEESHLTTDLATVNERIDTLRTALRGGANAEAWQRLGELYILRYRITLYETLAQSLTPDQAADPEVNDRLWLSTGLEQLHGLIHAARRANDLPRVAELRGDGLVEGNLRPAIWCYQKSRERCPVQSPVHLYLGQLHTIAEAPHADQPHLERARQLAPANSVTYFVSGLMDLLADRLDDACANLRRSLAIDHSRYALVMRIAVPVVPAERIVRDVLPDDPFMLYDYARTWLTGEPEKPLQREAYARAEELLLNSGEDDRRSLVVLSDVQVELGKAEAALETLRSAVDLNPELEQIRLKLVNLLADQEKYDEALEELARVRRMGEDRPTLEALQKRLEKLRDDRLFSR
jgi:tetratricopeptide (TPR) repeat protein